MGPRSACMLWAVLLTQMLWAHNVSSAREAQWIWTPEHPRGVAPAGDCFFRKTFQVARVEQATVTITADDQYELFVNGRRVGAGQSIRVMETYDITRFLLNGRNVIGVRVINAAPGPAALVARVLVKPVGGEWVSYSTDRSWKTALDTVPQWQTAGFNDQRWSAAQEFGSLGETAPWDRREEVARERTSENQRFRIDPEFAVEEILSSEITGSLVAMAFNEFGHIIAAQEGGPLLLIYDTNRDDKVDKVRTYCEAVKHIQGILPLNGDVYVTGVGDAGPGIYRLRDEDRNGSLESVSRIVAFKGSPGEHAAHGLTLGPDGMIYCVLGNHMEYAGEYAASSPYRHYYEGDLVGPRMEDPGGHAVGIKAPGGAVIRTDLEGKEVEIVAGGLRNAYDLTFHPNGSLFVHDSDMEADTGTAWYRPTSLFEIVEGGEYGWRSGWSQWPGYYADRLPTLLETGRGSPTGALCYDHFAFPQRYHGALFLADWSEGRILAVRLQQNGAGHQAQAEVFLQGQPLNVTDLAVAKDGSLYFCTGGRGTAGGIYRVAWQGTLPPAVKDLGAGISRAIRQPQPMAAWGRQDLATLKEELGNSWNQLVAGVAHSDANAAKHRLRAMDLMQLYGPAVSAEMLLELSRSKNEQVRARSVRSMSAHARTEEVLPRIIEMLADSDPFVQRMSAEALLRLEENPPVDLLLPLLRSDDRYLAWSARRLLERIPVEQWKASLLGGKDQRLKIQAGFALVIAHPGPESTRAVIAAVSDVLDSFVSDRNLIDFLRLAQVALHRSPLPAEELRAFQGQLVAEFPIGEPLLNRELFRLLTFLNAEEVIDQALAFLQSDADLAERVHVALHMKFFKHSWNAAERFSLVKFYEEAQLAEGGSSYPLYIMHASRDICEDLPLEEARIFVAEGAKWPNAALVSLYRFPDELGESDLRLLRNLDQQIDGPGFEGDQYKRLRTGIVAMLSGSSDAESMEYLRQAWVRSPERRQAIALGLAQNPGDENWDYLIRSLPILETFAVTEVMNRLRSVDYAPDDPNALRETILHGLRMEQDGEDPRPAIKLLEHWTGAELGVVASGSSKMAPWQTWFAANYPDRLEAVLPKMPTGSRWNMETLLEYFNSQDGRSGNAEKGRVAFQKGSCARCHRMETGGKLIGPDLSAVAKRFTRKEVLEAILFPSHVISDQYATKRVRTASGHVYNGIVSRQGNGSLTVRDSDLNEHFVSEEDIEEVLPSKVSLMPSGLLDSLTAEEIRDMFAYMGFLPLQMAEKNAQAPVLR
jgi:putative heme-binding domain-containing protein